MRGRRRSGRTLARDEKAGGYRVDAHHHRPTPTARTARRRSRSPASTSPRATSSRASTAWRRSPRPTSAALLRGQAGKQVLLRVKPKARRRRARRHRHADHARRPRTTSATTSGSTRGGWRSRRRARTRSATCTCARWAAATWPSGRASSTRSSTAHGLIIDVRHNNGGNIDSWILGKLLRKAWFYWQPRVGQPDVEHAVRLPRPHGGARRPSDGVGRRGVRRRVPPPRARQGDRHAHVGRRDLAAARATSSSTAASPRRPRRASTGPKGQWLIEGHGVDPDIVVDNLPHATFGGKDAQLDAAIKHLQELIKTKPIPVPPPPPYPIKR